MNVREGTIAGPGGKVRLEPKVMDVLQVLARQAGVVVSRDELLGEVWSGVVVTEHTLSRCIYQLRNRLRETAGDLPAADFVSIETLTKRGYRLVVPGGLAITGTGGAPAQMSRAVGTVQATEPHTIAVLPFTDMSPNQDHAYFGDGIAEDLINGLSRIRDLRVKARTSSFRYRGTGNIPDIGRELRVGTVLEGSVRRSGNRIRITARLIDVASDTHLWSARYDRELGDVFAVQDDVAKRVINALQLKLLPASKRVMDVGTRDIDAYNAFLLGRNEVRRYTIRSFGKAVEYYHEALSHDPEYAAAYGELGVCLLGMFVSGISNSRETIQQAREALAQAKERGWDATVIPWIQIERLLEMQSRPDQKEQARADIDMVRNPDPQWRSFEYLHLSMLLARVGLIEAAIDYYRLHRSKVEYPVSEMYLFGLPSDVITLLATVERFEEAIDECTSRLAEDSEAHLIRAERCILYARVGNRAAAESDLAIVQRIWPRSFAQVCYLFWSGRETDALELFASMDQTGRLHPLSSMCGALLFRDARKFLHHLEQLVEGQDPTSLYVRVQLKRYASPDLIEEIERHPRYRAALDTLGIDEGWRRELAEMADGIAPFTGISVSAG